MKKVIIVSLALFIGYAAQAQTKGKAPVKKQTGTAKPVAAKPVAAAPTFKSTLDSASYALGLNVANSFKSGGLNTFNFELFNKGLKDVFAQAKPMLDAQQAQKAISKLFESLNAQREKNEEQKNAPNIKASVDFLNQNQTKAGIKTTASGLQYEVISEGSGAKPTATSQVTVHYKGTLLNGFEFDSSYKRGEPATFGLNQVIAGWTEGLQLMAEGAKYRLFLPYKLAYGSRGTPDGKVPPFSTLIFEVELIKIAEN